MASGKNIRDADNLKYTVEGKSQEERYRDMDKEEAIKKELKEDI